ncbi:MAG: hypothetical protein ABR941_09825 [Thermoleophilia bacterium]
MIFALWLVDTRTGLVREGRSLQAALLVDALLLGVGTLVYVVIIRRGPRTHVRRR